MVLFDIRWYQMPFCYILLWYTTKIELFQRDFVCYHQGILEASLTSPSSAWRSIPVNPGTMIDPTSTITNQSLGMCSFTTFVTTIHLGVILVRLPSKSLALRTFTMFFKNVFLLLKMEGPILPSLNYSNEKNLTLTIRKLLPLEASGFPFAAAISSRSTPPRLSIGCWTD